MVTREQVAKAVGMECEWLYQAVNNPNYDVKISHDGSVVMVSRLGVIPLEELTKHMEHYKTVMTKQ